MDKCFACVGFGGGSIGSLFVARETALQKRFLEFLASRNPFKSLIELTMKVISASKTKHNLHIS